MSDNENSAAEPVSHAIPLKPGTKVNLTLIGQEAPGIIESELIECDNLRDKEARYVVRLLRRVSGWPHADITLYRSEFEVTGSGE